MRWRREQNAHLKRVTLWRCESSDYMMSKVQFAPHRRSLFHCLALWMHKPIPMSSYTACRFMFSQNQHLVPSCQQQWYSHLPMGNYILAPQRVPVCLHNLSAPAIEIPTKAMVGQVVPANQVTLVVYLTRIAKETNNQASKGWVLKALDLQRLMEWPASEQRQVRELLLKWEHLFVHSDPDLGQTALSSIKFN